jgi:nitrate reductase molybdenum cofactor assembly chaperone NarJ/NarW
MRSLRALAALLAYPDDAVIKAVPEIGAVLAEESAIAPPTRQKLAALIAELSASDPLDVQERYVGLFDRTRSLSLHLFEHVYGESRERGPAMVALHERYVQAGYFIAGNEFPDYLPMYLEFLACLPAREVQAKLGEIAHVLNRMRDRLAKRASPYAAAFEALLEVSGNRAGEADEAEAPAEDLDKSWEDSAIVFGPEGLRGEQSCARANAIASRINAA